MLDRLSGRYGKRGTWLLVMGLVWLMIGFGLLLEPSQPRSWVAVEQLPLLAQALPWWITGAVAMMIGARGPDYTDTWGHVALYVMPAVRVLSFTLSWVLWAASSALVGLGICEHVIGWAGAWFAAMVWSVISLMLRLIADWANPSRPIPHPPVGATGEL